MPWGVAAAVGGSIAGSLVSGAMSPSTSGGGPSYYIPTGLGPADQAWQDLLKTQQGAQATIGNLMPYYQQSLDEGMAAQRAYAPFVSDAAGISGRQYWNLSDTLNRKGWENFGTQQSLLGAGQQVYNMGLDPQSALYDRTLNQLTQQTGATNSMYGLGSSAAGAGVQNQALSNFNIDWQNQQLQRALSGLQGYGQAAGVAGQYGQLGTQQISAAPEAVLQGGLTPYQYGLMTAQIPGQLAGQYASGVEQGPLSSAASISGQIIPYLNYGQGAQSIPYQSQAQGAGALGGLVSQGINQIGSSPQVQNALSNYFNPASGSFSGGNFGGAFSSSPYYSGGGNQYGFTM